MLEDEGKEVKGIKALERLKTLIGEGGKVSIDKVEDGVVYATITLQPKVVLDEIQLNFVIDKEKYCRWCKLNFRLEYWPGFGWYHGNTDGGPDLYCEDEEVQKRPNPEGE
jgi:hypothetical protein